MKNPNIYFQTFATLMTIMSIALGGCGANKGNGLAGEKIPGAQSAQPAPNCNGVHPITNMGGESGGGGSTLPKDPASSDQITNLVSDLKTYIPWVLYRFENLADQQKKRKDLDQSQKDQLAIYQKLITNEKGQTVYELLKNWKMVAKAKGPCKDLRGEDADASAFGNKPDEICFSVERLSKKLRMEEVLRSLIALSIHEISHRMGIGLLVKDHDDSVKIQKDVESKLPLLLNVSLSDIKIPFRSSFNNLSNDITTIQEKIKKNEDLSQICLWLDLPTKNIDDMFAAYMNASKNGIDIGRPRVFWRMLELQMLTGLTQGSYCNSKVTTQHGASPIPLRILMDSLKIWPEDADPSENISVVTPNYGDNKALSELLIQILELVKRSRADLPTELFEGY